MNYELRTMLIDTHAHLYWDSYNEDLDKVLDRALEAGITTIINIGVDIETSKKVATFKHPKIKFYSHIGIHPHEATKYHKSQVDTPGVHTWNLEKDINTLEQIYLQNKDSVIGIGECGLDFFFRSNDLHQSNLEPQTQIDLQKKLLAAQIDLAKKLNLPLSIHVRDDRSIPPTGGPPLSAWDEIFEFLEDTFGVLHCYSGFEKHTKKALKTDYLFSFAGNITYPKNSYLIEAVKLIPLDRIVLETDCPFLSPQSSRGSRNEPSNIKEIAEHIAQIKDVSFEEVARQTTENVRKLYNL